MREIFFGSAGARKIQRIRALFWLDGFDEAAEGNAALVSVVHHEDIDANDKVWEGLKAPLTKQGRLSPLEKSIWQMNQWWLEKMNAPAE